MLLLRRTLNSRIGLTGLPFDQVMKLWSAAIAGAAVAWLVKITLPSMHPALAAVMILGPYGLVYLAAAVSLGVSEASSAISRFRRV
jgi:putative peptidoglycan lipid II flippase